MNEKEFLDGKTDVYGRNHFMRVKKKHKLSAFRIEKESGVARATQDRIIENKKGVGVETYVKLGKWIIEKEY